MGIVSGISRSGGGHFTTWPVGRSVGCGVDRLVRLVVKASASAAEDPGFESRLRRDFSGSSYTSDFKTGTSVATLPGAWHYRVSAGTGRPGVSILWLGEVESWICNFYLSVAARKIMRIRPWDTPACCWNVKHTTNKQTNYIVATEVKLLDHIPPITFLTVVRTV